MVWFLSVIAGVLAIVLPPLTGTVSAQSNDVGSVVWTRSGPMIEKGEKGGWVDGSVQVVDYVNVSGTSFQNIRKYIASGKTLKNVELNFEFDPPREMRAGEPARLWLSGRSYSHIAGALFAEKATTELVGERIGKKLVLRLGDGDQRKKRVREATFVVPENWPNRFVIYAKIGTTKVTWTYKKSGRVSPTDAYAEGQLVGHIAGATRGAKIVRGLSAVDAYPGMPIYGGDEILTGDKEYVRLSMFSDDMLAGVVKKVDLYVFDEHGNRYLSYTSPVPKKEKVVEYLDSMSPKELSNYLSAVGDSGTPLSIGHSTHFSIRDHLGEFAENPSWSMWLKQGFVRVKRRHRDFQIGRSSRESVGGRFYVHAGVGRDPGLLTNERLQRRRAAREARERGEQKAFRKWIEDRQQRGFSGTTVLRPKGTDFTIESIPETGFLRLSVNEGEVEWEDVESSMVATIRAGETMALENGIVGRVASLSPEVWDAAVSLTDFGQEPIVPGQVTRDRRTVTRIPSLNAEVTNLKFFASPYKMTPYAERKYSKRFSRASTRYVGWEMNLDYPQPGRKRPFEIMATWYNPDGSVNTVQPYKTSLGADWTSSHHQQMWGWKEPGNWKPGTYRVKLTVDGQVVADNTFDIYEEDRTARVRDELSDESLFSSLPNVAVMDLKFFETSRTLTPYRDRIYSTGFSKSSTRYISWELNLGYSEPSREIPFDINAKWYRADGSLLAQQKHAAVIQAGWTSSHHSLGWGRQAPGKWAPGTYRVELSIGSQVITSGRFNIND